MKRWYAILVMAASILSLAACSTPTIHSEVTVFQQWQPSLLTQPYAFERNAEQGNHADYRRYEDLIRTELQQLGLAEASGSQKPKLSVRFDYGVQARDVRVVQPVVVDPFYYGPLYGPRWHRRYTPFYDPYWYGVPVHYSDGRYVVYRRQLHVVITGADDAQKYFDVTVVNNSTRDDMPAAMPYLVRSAFADFPGTNGEPRQVELEMKE